MICQVIKLLSREGVVVCDGLNYIKGFRYELYCASKAAETTQCTVHCDLSVQDCEDWNRSRQEEGRWDDEVLAALAMRYEAPVCGNRWDAPLHLVLKMLPWQAVILSTNWTPSAISDTGHSGEPGGWKWSWHGIACPWHKGKGAVGEDVHSCGVGKNEEAISGLLQANPLPGPTQAQHHVCPVHQCKSHTVT